MLTELVIPERGRYYHEHRTIVLRRGLGLAEQRSVLWHELVHAERGDFRCQDPVLNARQEMSVDREAARRAMPWPVLRWAVDEASCQQDFVDRLKVDPALVQTRLDCLHPAERAYVKVRCAEIDAA